MSWRRYFLGLSGRIERSKFWLGVALIAIAGTALSAALHVTEPLTGTAADPIRAVFAFAAITAMTWFAIALTFRRLHDRGRSGWMTWLFWFVPPIMLSYATARNSPATDFNVLLLYLPDFGEIVRGASNGLLGFAIPAAAAALVLWGFIEIGGLRGSYGPNRFGPDPLGEVKGELPGQL